MNKYHVCLAAGSLPGVCITQTWKITLVSLSGCIVQSNFRCASCVLQHLLLPHVKHTSSFHRYAFPESLSRFHKLSMIIYE